MTSQKHGDRSAFHLDGTTNLTILQKYLQGINPVSFETYGNYSSNNYGVNALVFTDVNKVDYYFSYKTLVAFDHKSTGLVIRENIWGNTTGKHLNWIDDDKSKRVNENTFIDKLCELKDNLVINVPTL